MKKRTYLLALVCTLLFSGVASAQLDYNKWSVELAGGVNKTMGIQTPGFTYPTFDLFNANLSVRRMFNSKFGLMARGEFDRFNTTYLESEEHQTQLIKFGLQGVFNLGRMANFEEFSKRFSLLAHLGGGYGMMTDVSTINKVEGTDNIGYLTVGLSPIIKLAPRVALSLDGSIYGSVFQQRTFDFNSNLAGRPGFDSYFGTITAGLIFYLGKNAEHLDWKFEGDELLKRIEALEADLENTKGDVDLLGQDLKAVEKKMQDDDNDGVANYLDIEPNTPEGVTVNTKGQEVKMPVVNKLTDGNNEEGLFYTVQLGVFAASIPERYWKGITPLYKLSIEDGTTRYFSGIFHSVDEARPKLGTAKGNGLVDSFITAYYKGNRITIAEADLILSTRGEEALRPKPEGQE